MNIGKLLAIVLVMGIATWMSNGLAKPYMAAPSSASFMAGGDMLAAFPEAEGWGALALSTGSPNDCRAKPLKVHRVTTTAIGGAVGTWDSVLNQLSSSNYDVIVFTTGGVHDHQPTATHEIDANCVYIAGPTAPGDGFVQRGHRPESFQSRNRSDIVIRGLTVQGQNSDPSNANPIRVISSDGASTDTRFIVIDHVSMQFQHDQFNVGNFNVSDSTAKDYTVSYTIAGADIDGPGWNFAHGLQDYPIKRFTGHHNFIAELRYRSPLIDTCMECDWIENVSYNWAREGLISRNGANPPDERSYMDIIANHWKPGPRTTSKGTEDLAIQVWRLAGRWDREPQLYLSKNISDSVSVDSTADQKNLCTYKGDQSGACNDSIFFGTSRMGTQTFPVTRRWQSGMLGDSLLDIVGNSWRVDCSGVKQTDRRDAVDDSLVAHFRNDTGRDSVTYGAVEELISTGLPSYATGTACTDTDNDGLPNEFEDACVGNTTSMTPGGDLSGDGYLNVEEYINGTANTRTIAWDDNSANEDGFEIQRDVGAGFVVLDSVAINVTTYTDYDSRIGHRYRVRAYSTEGQSAFTNVITSTCN